MPIQLMESRKKIPTRSTGRVCTNFSLICKNVQNRTNPVGAVSNRAYQQEILVFAPVL